MYENRQAAICGDLYVLRNGSHIILAPFTPLKPDTLHALSQDEQHAYAEFRCKTAAQAFVHRRAVLRHLLSVATGISQSDLRYERGQYGKLRLGNLINPRVHFSLSQGDGLCAIAINHGQEVGIDIEQATSADAMDDIRDLLHQDEIAFIQAAADERRAFLDIWVQKEAVAKRMGTGFSVPAASWSCLDPVQSGYVQIIDINAHRLCVSTSQKTAFQLWRITDRDVRMIEAV